MLEDNVRDRALVAEGFAEIAAKDAGEIAPVLHREREIEAESVAELREVFGAGAFAEHLLHGIAGDDVGE